ncbi:hypothetical protein [Neobacillus cucumis]|uniref:hypothetical protein n=1 Tax=Neobacillus cucumis TaxID=1740721 RepID=UPI0028534CD2|nr:hypothetical protein [Neobacillus cucumis]MDR4947696.1 hypothetical protein [Neobacillus cucumis]
MSNKENENNENNVNSRRTYLRNTGLTVGDLVLGGTVGNLLGKKNNNNQETTKQT